MWVEPPPLPGSWAAVCVLLAATICRLFYGDLLRDHMPRTDKFSMVIMSTEQTVVFMPMNFHIPLNYINLFVKPVEKIHRLLTVKPIIKTVWDNYGVSTHRLVYCLSELEIKRHIRGLSVIWYRIMAATMWPNPAGILSIPKTPNVFLNMETLF